MHVVLVALQNRGVDLKHKRIKGKLEKAMNSGKKRKKAKKERYRNKGRQLMPIYLQRWVCMQYLFDAKFQLFLMRTCSFVSMTLFKSPRRWRREWWKRRERAFPHRLCPPAWLFHWIDIITMLAACLPLLHLSWSCIQTTHPLWMKLSVSTSTGGAQVVVGDGPFLCNGSRWARSDSPFLDSGWLRWRIGTPHVCSCEPRTKEPSKMKLQRRKRKSTLMESFSLWLHADWWGTHVCRGFSAQRNNCYIMSLAAAVAFGKRQFLAGASRWFYAGRWWFHCW